MASVSDLLAGKGRHLITIAPQATVYLAAVYERNAINDHRHGRWTSRHHHPKDIWCVAPEADANNAARSVK